MQGQTQKQQETFTPNPTYIVGWGVVPGSYCSLDRETEMADAWETCHALPLWWFRTISRLFIRNHGGQKEVTQYFPSIERKELSTQNSITRENILQEWKDRGHQGYSNLSHHLISTSWETSADANMKQKNHPVKPCSNFWPTGLWANKTLLLENKTKKNEWKDRDYPGGPLAKNLPWNAGRMGSIAGWGTKIPHASGQLSPPTSIRSPHA